MKTGKTEYADSSYELRRFQALDKSDLVKTWTKEHGIRIPYKYHRSRHRYLPDILVEYHDGRIFLEEVKGYIYSPGKFVSKNGAAKLYCGGKNWTYRLIFKDGLDTVE